MNSDCNPCSNVDCTDETITTNSNTCNDTGFAWPSIFPKAKVPVRVGFAHVGGVIVDNVTFPADERFSEVNEIRRKCVVTQAKIVCHQLIVEGFIKKNIMYTVPVTSGTTVCCPVVRNEIRDIEVKVPFCFSTSLYGLDLGHLHKTHESEKAFLENTMGDNVCDRGIMQEADCAKVHQQFTPLNTPPFAELEAYSICELALNRHGCADGLFNIFTEKFVLKLSFSIYRYKHAFIPWITAAGAPDVTAPIAGDYSTSNASIPDSEDEISEGLMKLQEEF